jgi:hypothetical protein
MGVTHRSFNVSTTRLVGGVAFGVVVLSLAATVSQSLNSSQVMLWAGNLMYLGALAGWFVTDTFRRP